jgi:hypothetical protein
MTPAELAALLVAHAAPALAFLAGHPLALLLGWQALSALVTALGRPAVRAKLEAAGFVKVVAFIALCEAAGVNLPALLAWVWQALRLALDVGRPKP